MIDLTTDTPPQELWITNLDMVRAGNPLLHLPPTMATAWGLHIICKGPDGKTWRKPARVTRGARGYSVDDCYATEAEAMAAALALGRAALEAANADHMKRVTRLNASFAKIMGTAPATTD